MLFAMIAIAIATLCVQFNALAQEARRLAVETKCMEFSNSKDIVELQKLAMGVDGGSSNGFIGILGASNYRELMKRLEAKQGVNILSTPEVMTVSGRQAQIKIVDVKDIRWTLDDATGAANRPIAIPAEPFQLERVLNVVPVVRQDGLSIDMTLIAAIREFRGYDLSRGYFDSGPPRPLTPPPLRDYAGEHPPVQTRP
jgi:type II secretory pathway component GspD/PulD (secretin)